MYTMKTQKNTFENLPEWLIEKWQDIADILAESIGVPAALVMKTEDEFRKVFISSQSENNPYHVGDKEKWHGLYCETVIKTQHKLSINNALKDKNWDKNPDIKLGMIAYLGFPLNLPNNQPFGTLCILDNKENSFKSLDVKLLLQFKNVIELDLALIQTNDTQTNELAKTIKVQQSQQTDKNIELQKAKAEESDKRYKIMLNAAMLPIVISTFVGKVLLINQAAADFFGVTFDEIDNLSSPDFWANPSQRSEFVSQLKENGVVNNIEIEYKTKKNGIRHTIMSSTIIDYDDDKAILNIFNDDTDRKIAEQALRLSEEKFAKAFNISPDAITLTDIETSEIIDANAGFERVYGYAVKDVIGKTALELDVWADLTARSELIKILNRDGVVLDFEANGRRKSGELFHALIYGSIITVGEKRMLVLTARDITERKRAEEKLKESENKYRDIVENAPMGIFRRDMEGKFQYINPCIIRQLECKTENEFLDNYGLISQRWVRPERNEEFKALLLENRRVADYEIESRLIDGSTKWFALYAFLDDSDQFINGFSLDITERKKAEEVLSQSEARLNALLSSMKDIIFEIDLNGCFEGYYARDIKELYVQPDSFIRKKFDEILPTNISKLLNEAIENIYKGKQFEQFEYTITIGNKIQHESVIVTPRFNTLYEVIGTTAVCRDITERKLAEENYMESQRKLATLMANLPGLAFRCMNDRDWTMLFMSEGCFELTGYYPHELEGNQINSYGNLIHRDDAEMVWQKVQDAIIKNTFWQVEYKIHTKDGKEKWVWEQGCGVYSNAGELEVLEGFISDISLLRKQDLEIAERKREEEELKSSRDQLRNFASHLQRVREKERVLIALEIHDSLAQFLVALKMDIGVFRNKILKGDDMVKKIDILAVIEKFIKETEYTINSARNIMNGLRPDQLELLGLVDTVEVHLRQFEEIHHLKYKFENNLQNLVIPPEEGLVLFRILQESLNNILKHAMATQVNVKLNNNSGNLILEISDNGVGFDIKNCGGADSYGLIDMKELVRMLGGTFDITSKLGEGATVKVEIPFGEYNI